LSLCELEKKCFKKYLIKPRRFKQHFLLADFCRASEICGFTVLDTSSSYLPLLNLQNSKQFCICWEFFWLISLIWPIFWSNFFSRKPWIHRTKDMYTSTYNKTWIYFRSVSMYVRQIRETEWSGNWNWHFAFARHCYRKCWMSFQFFDQLHKNYVHIPGPN
jgi:hypothetical protein